MKIVNLTKELYRFFPRDVNPFDSAFDLTKETKNKWVAVPERRSKIHSKWKEFIDVMNELFPHEHISDDSAIFNREFCNYCSFYKSSDKVHFKFHVLLSLLIPVHTVLITGYSLGDQKEIFTCDYEDVAPRLQEMGIGNVSIEREAVAIHRLLERIFQSEMVTKKGLDSVLVPDVGTQKLPNGNVPLFDLVFTDYLLTY